MKNNNNYLIIKINENHKFIKHNYQGRIITKQFFNRLQWLDEKIYRYNKNEGRDEYGTINEKWAGYCKMYIDQYEQGEKVAHYRLDLGEGVEANSHIYKYLTSKLNEYDKLNEYAKIGE